MSSYFIIEPAIVVTKTLVQGRVSVFDYIPFTSAMLACMLFDESGTCIDNRIYKLEGEDFANWGNDDEYLVEYVKAQLGVQVSA